jgi:flagellar M-ring protein FliF
MNLFSRAYLQLLLELYRSMAPGSRLTAGMLATVVVLSAGYLLMHQGASPEVDLMHGLPLSAAQLPAIHAALAKANLKTYEVRGTSVFVPRGQEADYMAALAAGGALPPSFGAAQHQAVNGNTMFEFGPQHDQRMRIAKQDELAQAICKMPGIESAYVLYDIDSKPGGFHEKVITATALVKPAGVSQLDEARVSAIRKMVAGAIAGLRPENVAVADLTGRTWYGNADDAAGGGDNVYISLKRTYEQDLKTKILGSLGFIPNVIVEANVVPDRQRYTRIKQDERSTAGDRHGSQHAIGAGGKGDRTGRSATAQQPNTATILGSLLGGVRNNEEPTEPEAVEPVSRVQVEKESVGLTPTVAGVSVGVPISYFKKVWQERNPAAPGQPPRTSDRAALDQIRIEESAKIQRHVAQLLPSIEGAAKTTDLVTVTTFQDIPIVEPPAPEFQQELLSWLRQSWRMLATIGLTLISLLALRSMVRAPRAEATEPVTAGGRTTVEEGGRKSDGLGNPSYGKRDELENSSYGKVDDLENSSYDRAGAVPPPHARGFYGGQSAHSTGSALRDELSQLIEDDPEAAASVLRSWIGHTE